MDRENDMRCPPLFSPVFLPILERLKKEGLYLGQDEREVKPGSHHFEERAIRAVNEAFREVLALDQTHENLSEAARLVEKIQVAASEAGRAAFISHSPQALKASVITREIASLGREIFHEIKERHTRKKAA